MTPLPFDEAYVAAHATGESYERGGALCDRGAVEDVVRRGADLFATVWASEAVSCHPRARLTGDGVEVVVCTCTYSGEGWCPHVVALLLQAARLPAAIPERPTLDAVLAPLDAGRLRALLRVLADDDPALVEQIEWLADRE